MSLSGNSEKNIKYLFLGKAPELKELGEINIQTKPEWPIDCKTIFQNICGNNLEANLEQRNKVKSKDSVNFYYFYVSENYYFFFAVVDSLYPENQVFKFFEEIFKENIPLLRDDKGKLNNIGNSKLKELTSKFQNPNYKNEINNINKDLNEIKIEMKNNIKNIIHNVDDASELKNQSDKIASASNDFAKQSSAVKRQTCMQNIKLWLILGAVILVLVIIIIIVAVPKSSNDGDEVKKDSNSPSNSNNTTRILYEFMSNY